MISKELSIPDGITFETRDNKLVAKGKNGCLEKDLKFFHKIKIHIDNNKLIVSSDSDDKKTKAMIGTIIAHARNLIKGVSQGYTYKMKIVYTHFPITTKIEGDKFIINNFLGERTQRIAKILGDTKVQVNGQDIVLTGSNKELVSQTAANIETSTRITKKDRRIFQDGIYILKER